MLIARSTVLLFMALVPVSVVWSTTLQGHDFARVAQVLLVACGVVAEDLELRILGERLQQVLPKEPRRASHEDLPHAFHPARRRANG